MLKACGDQEQLATSKLNQKYESLNDEILFDSRMKWRNYVELSLTMTMVILQIISETQTVQSTNNG